MENASKALIMAAEILIGVMLLSMGVYLFNMFADYSSQTTQKINDNQLAQFNNQFLKYEGQRTRDDGTRETIKCTIHDVASIVNLAKKNNEEYELASKTDNNFYVQVRIFIDDDDLGNYENENLEQENESNIIDLIKQYGIKITDDTTYLETNANIKYYQCICNINEITKRVDTVTFTDYTT